MTADPRIEALFEEFRQMPRDDQGAVLDFKGIYVTSDHDKLWLWLEGTPLVRYADKGVYGEVPASGHREAWNVITLLVEPYMNSKGSTPDPQA